MTCNHHTYKIIMMVSVLSPWFWKIWEDFFVARLIRSKNCGGRTGGQRGFGGKGKTGFDVFSRVLWLPFSFCSESRIWQKDRGRCNAYRQTRFGRVALGKRRIQSLVIGIAMTGSLVEVSSWSVLVHPFKIYTHIIPNPLSSKLSTGKGWKGSRAGLKLQLFPAHIPRCCQGTWRHALAWTGFG